ncbi:zinc ribbon domain-containing protein [Bacillus chungangensis]|uniref:zinc ribbon domain-containing protein n=1 Tax=Bacillus chungangensis TaxID=587633 RepID=UPI00352139CE
MCSKCGNKDEKKPLYIREWTCPVCDAHHDKDVNASISILKEGKTTSINLCISKNRRNYGNSLGYRRETADCKEIHNLVCAFSSKPPLLCEA